MTSVNGGVREDCPFVGRQVDGRYLRIVLKNPRSTSADSGCDDDQGGRFEYFASCGEDRRRERDERQFPQVLGGGRQ
jgi:hypothetical protein